MIKPVNSNVQCMNRQNVQTVTQSLMFQQTQKKGEILSCPGCGLELEVKQVKGGCVDLQELTIEGEDWGE